MVSFSYYDRPQGHPPNILGCRIPPGLDTTLCNQKLAGIVVPAGPNLEPLKTMLRKPNVKAREQVQHNKVLSQPFLLKGPHLGPIQKTKPMVFYMERHF